MSNTEPPGGELDAGRRPRMSRILVAAAVLVAVALLGASGGLLLASPAHEQEPGAVDVGFAQDMTAHHRQGVQMARVALQRSTDTEIQQIAYDIAATQTEQMGRMRGWLALWSKPMRPTGEHMSWMSGTGMRTAKRLDDTGRLMPGMATREELQRLSSLSAPKLGTYFLQLMIRHHQGGAPMMRAASERAEIAAVRNLANKMLISQTAEAKTMKRMLADRGAEPLPGPA